MKIVSLLSLSVCLILCWLFSLKNLIYYPTDVMSGLEVLGGDTGCEIPVASIM